SLKGLLYEWLHGCYVADDLKEALRERHTLLDGEAFYVPAGHSVTKNAISFYAPDSEQAGMLARQQEIENFGKQIKAQALIVEQVRTSLVRVDSTYHQTEQKLTALRGQVKQKQERMHALQVEMMRLSQQAETAQLRSQQLSNDLEEVEVQVQALQESKVSAEGQFEELDLVLSQEQEKQARLEELVMAAEQALSQRREQSRSLENRAQEAAFTVRALKARQQELERAVTTAGQQILSLSVEAERIQTDLTQYDDAAARAGLQAALEEKVASEQQLSQMRQVYEALTQDLRSADEQRMQMMQELDPLRQKVTDCQLKEQAAQMGVDQYTQYLSEAGVSLEQLAQSVQEDGVELESLQEEMGKLQHQVDALGAVNLAAFEELESSYERKKFLDAQVEDLSKAIRTLENAIVKIDRQTRDLLTSTFNAVNHHFGKMFPELFGGGHAKLVMTGDEILNSGVQVMAQPPGKRNSTIHLLSGGEKALTAIALVFAIFQLNPAPFCLLDEVDAPLDDANTERYAKLVTHMSEETQFLFISHNKIAMEMAEQLIGVTMQEQGVSRIVAVDMKEALDMANG
ncbi:MAG: chromosome segregation protein SMC, partial [Saezia sp.]